MITKVVALALAALIAAAPLSAQPTEIQKAKVIALWQIALDDWSPLFTCGAMNIRSDAFIRKAWGKTSNMALKAMKAADWPKSELDKLSERVTPDAMRLSLDKSFAEVLKYCDRHPDWLRHAVKVDGLAIGDEVGKVLNVAGSP